MMTGLLSEPSMGNVMYAEGEELHGVVLHLDSENKAKMDAIEPPGHLPVVAVTYDGVERVGYCYHEETDAEDVPPSKRYLDILVDGAREAGLDEGYIEKLAAREYYVPSEATLKKRSEIPPPSELPMFTFEELTMHDQHHEEPWSCVVGYIFRVKENHPFMKFLYGKETTKIILTRYNRKDISEAQQIRPFPPLDELREDELDAILLSLDTELHDKEIIGVLQEFWEDQAVDRIPSL
eukprot:TRINITY_DN2870_c0_g1_i2.p1 TRINITY_DN2870_c0_g1~~TRINITY_DN2870_c0_g1_i2.p1  ORF type:complete len:237 (+),score=56.66 TRINITY_DN2870_c0_g1_i2:266-976(+)